MNAATRLNYLKQQKTSHSTEQLDTLGWACYAEIQDNLERERHGDYVMIEVDSGDYFVGDTPEQALQQAEAAHPDKVFCLIRIGYKAAHKLKRNETGDLLAAPAVVW